MSILSFCLALLVTSGGCLASQESDGISDDELKALVAADEQAEASDTLLEFDANEQPVDATADFTYDVPYRIATTSASNGSAAGADGWFPKAIEWIQFLPTAINTAVKAITWLPDEVADWFRASDYYAWRVSLKEASSAKKISVYLALSNVNWRLSRGKASLQLCRIEADGDADCDNLGSVKKGTRSVIGKVDADCGFLSNNCAGWFAFTLREYTRKYDVTLEPGYDYQFRVKHKLACVSDDWVDGCVTPPSITALFTETPYAGN